MVIPVSENRCSPMYLMKKTVRNTTFVWDQQKQQRNAQKAISSPTYQEIASLPMRSRTVVRKRGETIFFNKGAFLEVKSKML